MSNPYDAPPTGPGATEQDAYATACAISASLVERYPDIAEDLAALLDAVKVEQRFATQAGRPLYTAAEELIQGCEQLLGMPNGR